MPGRTPRANPESRRIPQTHPTADGRTNSQVSVQSRENTLMRFASGESSPRRTSATALAMRMWSARRREPSVCVDGATRMLHAGCSGSETGSSTGSSRERRSFVSELFLQSKTMVYVLESEPSEESGAEAVSVIGSAVPSNPEVKEVPAARGGGSLPQIPGVPFPSEWASGVVTGSTKPVAGVGSISGTLSTGGGGTDF